MYTNELARNQTVVVMDDCAEIFFSYGTKIATRFPDGSVCLKENWDLSRTTTKWLCKFLGISNKELKDKVNSKEFTIISSFWIGEWKCY